MRINKLPANRYQVKSSGICTKTPINLLAKFNLIG